MKKLKILFLFSGILAIVNPAFCALVASDFEDGTLQGWTGAALPQIPTTAPSGWTLTFARDPASGNGYMGANDIDAGGSSLYGLAPAPFTGNLSVYSGLQWDEFIPSHGAATVNIINVYLVGADQTRYYHQTSGGTLNTWVNHFAPFSASAWNHVDGSASFETVIGNVQALFISMETSQIIGTESAMDNISLIPVPEPSFVALLSLAAAGVLTWRLSTLFRGRRIQTHAAQRAD